MLPHIKNSHAGVNRLDPVHNNIFEVYFTLPEEIANLYPETTALLTEHVLAVSGLDALNRAPEVSSQKFMGTERSYINPGLDSTRCEFEIRFSLNLNNGTDNYVLNLFRSWAKLGYDISTGKRSLKNEYCADWMKISIANRRGDIFQNILFKDVMINGPIDGMAELDYESLEAQEITVKFVSDYWDDLNTGLKEI